MRYQSVIATAPIPLAPLRCLIVDDAPQAAALAACVRQVPALRLAGTCTSPEQARAFLQMQAVDVLFLSIELPLLAGLALLQGQEPRPVVVLTSTYPDYNLHDYGTYGVVDYLPKPVSPVRFRQVAERLSAQREPSQRSALAAIPFAQPQADGLYFWLNQQLVQVRLSEVLYVEDLGGRTRLQTLHQAFVVELSFATLADQLPEPQFLRVNARFVVALGQAAPVAGNTLAVAGRCIAVSAALQDEVLARAFQTNLWGA